MADKATSKRCRRPGWTLAMLSSLVVVLAIATPALTQEGAPVTGILTRPEITTYQYGTYALTDESTGLSYALESGSLDLDPYLGQRITVYGTPVPGYQDGQVEGGPDLLSVTSVEPGLSGPDLAGSSDVPFDPSVTRQAAQEAQQASGIAETALQSVQRAADTGDFQTALQAAEEAQQASETAQIAAGQAEEAAEQADDPEAQILAQEARQAADEAREASGAAQTVAQVASNAAGKVADIEDTYDEVLKAARPGGDDNIALAAEQDDEADTAGEDTGDEDAADDEKTAKKGETTEDAGEDETEDRAGEIKSSTSSTPTGGSAPLLLGGGILLVAGVFVARQLIR